MTTISPFLLQSIKRNSCSCIKGGRVIPAKTKVGKIKWVQQNRVSHLDSFAMWAYFNFNKNHRN